MRPLQKVKQLWRSNAGYAMIMVLCALLLFTVLGSNALLAAQASAGTTARKKDDTQAYVLAVSSMRCVAEMIETGTFSQHIKDNVLKEGIALSDSLGNLQYVALVTAQIDLPEQPAGMQQPTVTVDFTAEGVRGGGTVERTADLLTARITVQYLSASYSFLADFRQLPTQPAWKLRGYRNNRV